MSRICWPQFEEHTILRSFVAWAAGLSLLLAGFLVPGGCGEDKDEAAAETWAIEKEFKRGPVIFTVRVSHKELTIADRLRLELAARADEAFDVNLPEFGEKLEQFGIVEYFTPPPELVEDGKVKTIKRYVLEPFLSGDYTIPPMRVTFGKKGEEKKSQLESEALTVRVTSLLPEKVAELTIRGIAPPVALPRKEPIWVYAAIALVALGLAAALGIRLWLKRSSPVVRVQRPAHEIAYDALQALIEQDLVAEGQVKAFYLALSTILRHYIESRFGLHAPERTTEEFLQELRSTDQLEASHKALLKRFLLHCDLVKFAEHAPSEEEIQQAFDACKQFIAETIPEAPASAAA